MAPHDQPISLRREHCKEITIKSVDDLKTLLSEVETIIEELNNAIAEIFAEDNCGPGGPDGGPAAEFRPVSARHPLLRERANMELLREILLLHDKFTGLNRKVQLKPMENRHTGRITQVQVVAKWGGEITKVGREQALELGLRLRTELYRDEALLALHSTFRHNFKLYSSLEGRCQVKQKK